MRVLVCGGRDYSDAERVHEVLNELRPSVVIHGAARGADTLAGLWAAESRVETKAYPADWDAHGKAAGPIRNSLMLLDGKPDLVVAFPGARGTDDMISKARRARVPVRLVD